MIQTQSQSRFVIGTVAFLAVIALACGTVLIIHGDLDAGTAWPGLLGTIVVPVILAMLGVRQENVAAEVRQSTAVSADVAAKIGGVEQKVNGRFSDLLSLLAQTITDKGLNPDAYVPAHSEDAETLRAILAQHHEGQDDEGQDDEGQDDEGREPPAGVAAD